MSPSNSAYVHRRVCTYKREDSEVPVRLSPMLSLAPELLQQIGDELGSGRKVFRLTCKQVNRAVEAQVLSHLSINLQRKSIAGCPEQLDALLSKQTRIPLFARTLALKSLSLPAERPRFTMFPLSRVDERDEWDDDDDDTWVSPDVLQDAHQKFSERLGPALAVLTNVHTILWKVHVTDSNQTITTVLDYACTLPNLRTFNLELANGCPLFPELTRLKDLQQLVIHADGNVSGNQSSRDTIAQLIAASPKLLKLELDTRLIAYGPDPPRVHTLFKGLGPSDRMEKLACLVLCGFRPFTRAEIFSFLPALKSLTFINPLTRRNPNHFDEEYLKDEAYDEEMGTIWEHLRVSGIYLESLHIDTIDYGVLEYLDSYPTNHNDTITTTNTTGTSNTNISASLASSASTSLRHLKFKKISALSPASITTRFWTQSLPKHAPTLETLCIQPLFEGRWCHMKSYNDILRKCVKLKELVLSVNTVNAMASQSEAAKYEPVDTLIDSALLLPSLVHLSITSADDPKNAYTPCGSPSVLHHKLANEIIRGAIATFPCVPATTLLQFIATPGQTYQLRTSRAIDPSHPTCTMDYQPVRDR